jgi:hypothetical protein
LGSKHGSTADNPKMHEVEQKSDLAGQANGSYSHVPLLADEYNSQHVQQGEHGLLEHDRNGDPSDFREILGISIKIHDLFI